MKESERISVSTFRKLTIILFLALALISLKRSLTTKAALLERVNISNMNQAEEPPAWTVYEDARYKYKVSIPSNWNILPTPLEGNGATATFDNVVTDTMIGPDNWPEGGYTIDITVLGDVKIQGSLLETVAQYLENDFNSVVDISEVVESTNPYVRAVLSKKYGPPRIIEVRALQLLPNDVLVVSVSPANAWGNPDITAIFDSLVLDPTREITIPPESPTTSSVSVMSISPSPKIENLTSQSTYACDWGDEVGESPIELYLPFADGRTATVGGSYGFYYGEGWSHIDGYNDYYATDWNLGTHDTDCGKQIFAVAEGTVLRSIYDPQGYGNYIEITHEAEVTTLSAHLQSRLVSQGQTVSINSLLGYMGKTGAAGDICHLHLSYRVDGISKYGDDSSRRPSPMWTETGYWDLCDGQSRQSSKSGITYQGYWRGGQGWQQTVPVENLIIQWGSSSWVQSSTWLNPIPGSGTIQALDLYNFKNTIWLSLWRNDYGYVKNVPLVDGEPQWSSVSWSGPVSLIGFPGSGSIQAQDNSIVGETLYQSFWRNNYGYLRTVPIEDGEIQWGNASSWSAGVHVSNFPGSGSIQAQSSYPLGNREYYQIFWRNNYGYSRYVPVEGNEILWDSASAWSDPVPLSSFPGSGDMQAIYTYPIP